MWKIVVQQVLDGKTNIPSPFHKDGIIQSIFVVVDEEERIGFLWIWCSKTYKGINMSRIKIPEKVDAVSLENFKEMDIPEINFIDPSF